MLHPTPTRLIRVASPASRCALAGRRRGPGARGADSPADGLTVLAVIRASAVDAIYRKVLRRRAAIEVRLRHARIAREEDALIAADRAAIHGAHVVAFCLERRADQAVQVGLERQHVR